MKYAIIKRGIFAVLGAAVFGGALLAAGCSDWTESRPEFIDKPGHTARYYASLRDYKNSDHARYFGWYAGWVGTGARMSNSLRGLPDSLDIVSLWENQTNLDRNRMEDMRYVQQVKGTKVLFTFIVRNCGDGCTPGRSRRRAPSGVSSKMTTRPAKRPAANTPTRSAIRCSNTATTASTSTSSLRTAIRAISP